MEEDISRKAVLILVVLSVVISILSTSLVMNTVYHVNFSPSPAAEPQETYAPPAAIASLTVPGEVEKGPAKSSTAVVSFQVPEHKNK